MYLRLTLIAWIVFFPICVHATLEFATGWEFGVYPSGNNGTYIVDSESLTHGTIDIAPPAFTDLDNDFAFHAANAGISTKIPIVQQFEGAAVGCFAEVERATATTYKIRLYYENDGDECQAGINDGTECTVDSDCISENAGEAGCKESFFASSADLSLNTVYEVVVGEDNSVGGPGDVQCRLWINGNDVCSQTRPQGTCDETIDGFVHACGASSDCNTACTAASSAACCTGVGTGTCNCSTPDVNDVTEIRYGPDANGTTDDRWVGIDGTTFITAGPEHYTAFKIDVTSIGNGVSTNWDLWLDDWEVEGAVSGDPNIISTRIKDITPTGTDVVSNWAGSRTGCSIDDRDCVDEGNSLPGSDNEISNKGSGSSKTRMVDTFNLTNIALSGDDLPDVDGTVLGAATWAVMSDNAPLLTQSIQTCQTSINGFASTIGNNIAGDSSWLPCGYSLATGTLMNSLTNVNAATIDMIVDNASCTTSCPLSASLTGAEVIIKQSLPLPPASILKDVNNDGVIRVTFTGDSVLNDLDQSLCGRFEQTDSIVACTQGATTTGDILYDLPAILAGTNGGRMACTTIRGNPGKPDYLVLMAGANTIVTTGNHGWTRPVAGFETGICKGGVNEGNGCSCPKNSGWITGTGRENFYCQNFSNDAGANYLKDSLNDGMTSAVCSACSTNADCGINKSCTIDLNCFGGGNANCDTAQSICVAQCVSGVCGSTGLIGQLTDTQVRYWMDVGCPDTPNCPNGLCYGPVNLAEAASEYQQIMDDVSVRAGGDAIELIFVSQPRGVANPEFAPMDLNKEVLESLASFGVRAAKARGIHYIDFANYLQINCINSDERECHRDSIHLSRFINDGGFAPQDIGIDKALDAIEDCLENIHGSSDGICTTNVCTGGKIGNSCAINTDCDLYHCVF